ncbi:MAG: cation:proton antiporter [Gemmatimonadales bacterium]|nr:MAG: cation:proton antiporter [Gemmatimonadales bacterium]
MSFAALPFVLGTVPGRLGSLATGVAQEGALSSGGSTASEPTDFLAILGVLLFFGLLLPRVLRPLHLPLATSLILVGAVMGPHGLALVELDPGLALVGFLGATFHMLLAGTEARELGLRPTDPDTIRVLALNAVVPGLVGVAVARGFGYEWRPALFVGIVFLSSSIMLVFGVVRTLGLARARVGRLLKRVAVVEDVAASVLALALFQTLAPHPRYPFPILAGLLLSSVVLLRMFLPEVVGYLFTRFQDEDGLEPEARLRLVIAVMLLVIFAYSAFDVQPVVAAFLVGFALAGIPAVAPLRKRLETLGYAFFIPVFLFVVGLETDLAVLARFEPENLLAVAVLATAVGSKVVTGFLGCRWTGLPSRDAALFSVASTMKLAVPLSATYVASDLGLIDARLFSALVLLSVATSLLPPLLLPLVARIGAAQTDAG